MSFEDFGVGEDNRFYKYIPEQALAHHGILGQKWGIRRYQNKDGSLTAEGKKHRLEEFSNDDKTESRRKEFNYYKDTINDVFESAIKNPESYKNIVKDYWDAVEKYRAASKYGDHIKQEEYRKIFEKEKENSNKSVKKLRTLIIKELNKQSRSYLDGTKIDIDDLFKTNREAYGKEELFYDAFLAVYHDKIFMPAYREYNSLAHHGILGQKWGVRRYQNADGSLTPEGMRRRAQQIDKSNAKYLKKYGDTINKKVEKAVEPYMKVYAERELNTTLRRLKKNGRDSRNYINAYNKRLAQLMNTAVGDLKNPETDYVVQFIAKRGEYGVHTALAHPSTDMSKYSKGVYADGRIAYRKEGVKTV